MAHINMSVQNGGKEEVIVCRTSNRADVRFDKIIGHIQDILLGEEFGSLQRGFLEKHYHQFEDSEENKFIYTDIFKQYTDLIEAHLNTMLKSRLPDFVMENFLETLKSRKEEVGEEILDMLLSFTDFLTFKQMVLDYKMEREGRSLDLCGLVINSLSAGAEGDCVSGR